MAYSQDLRDPVIDAVLVEGMSRRGAAVRFGVSETAAINWVKRVEQTGSRAPAQLGGYKPMMLAQGGGIASGRLLKACVALTYFVGLHSRTNRCASAISSRVIWEAA
jgi:hypothetical protein